MLTVTKNNHEMPAAGGSKLAVVLTSSRCESIHRCTTKNEQNKTPRGAHVTIRIFRLDDHEMVRRALRELLETVDDFEVVGENGAAKARP